MRSALSTDWRTGTTREQPDSVAGFFGRIDVEDVEWEPLSPYLIERATLAEQYDAQCKLEERLTQEYVTRLRNVMHDAMVKEVEAIKIEAKGLAHEIVVLERIVLRQRLGGRGFRKRPCA